MNTRISKKMRKAAAVVAVMCLPLAAFTTWSAMAQVAPGEPIKGTIQVNEGDDYQALAKITLEQAREAALAQYPGATFEEGELDEENGFLVYDIELKRDGQEIDVEVDAGNASVLHAEEEKDDDGWWIF